MMIEIIKKKKDFSNLAQLIMWNDKLMLVNVAVQLKKTF